MFFEVDVHGSWFWCEAEVLVDQHSSEPSVDMRHGLVDEVVWKLCVWDSAVVEEDVDYNSKVWLNKWMN
jgi:hypothetical protein